MISYYGLEKQCRGRRCSVPHALLVVLVLVSNQLQAVVVGEDLERVEDLLGGVEGDGVAQDVDDAGSARELLSAGILATRLREGLFVIPDVLRELLVHAREALHGPAVVAGVGVGGSDLGNDRGWRPNSEWVVAEWISFVASSRIRSLELPHTRGGSAHQCFYSHWTAYNAM